MELCVVSMELWGRHMGRHCVVNKIVSYLGPDFPLFHDVDILFSTTKYLDLYSELRFFYPWPSNPV